MVFDFDVLVVLDTFFNNISLVLEVVVFLKLKHKEPGRSRPFAVPGGLTGAWLCSIPKFLIILYAFYSVGFGLSLAIGVGLNAVFVLVALVWVRHTRHTPTTRHFGGTREEVQVLVPATVVELESCDARRQSGDEWGSHTPPELYDGSQLCKG